MGSLTLLVDDLVFDDKGGEVIINSKSAACSVANSFEVIRFLSSIVTSNRPVFKRLLLICDALLNNPDVTIGREIRADLGWFKYSAEKYKEIMDDLNELDMNVYNQGTWYTLASDIANRDFYGHAGGITESYSRYRSYRIDLKISPVMGGLSEAFMDLYKVGDLKYYLQSVYYDPNH